MISCTYTILVGGPACDCDVTVYISWRYIVLLLPGVEPFSDATPALFEALIDLADRSKRTPVVFLGDIMCEVAADSDPYLLTLAYHYAKQGYMSYVPAHPRMSQLREFAFAEMMAICLLETACRVLEWFVRMAPLSSARRAYYVEL